MMIENPARKPNREPFKVLDIESKLYLQVEKSELGNEKETAAIGGINV